MVFFLYRFLLAPLSVFLIHLLGILASPKLKEIIQKRWSAGWTFEKNPGKKMEKPFWIHAASGEIEYARPLIRELKKKYPAIPIIVTYSSPSAERILKNIPEVEAWCLAPWDLYWSCKKFVAELKPRCVFFARTDVWPELITQIHKHKIPSVLFSATFAGNSSRLQGPTKAITAYSLKLLSKIFVADNDDLKVLENSKIQVQAEVTGDTRYDQVFYRLEHPQPTKTSLQPNPADKILVAGSTWPEDEEKLLEWYKNHSQEVKLLLAPHEINPEHLEKIQSQLKKCNLEFDLYSQSTIWKKPILILDQIGILAELYTWGTWAFVGGSFKKQVHSVMEPLAAGLPVWVGPYHHNNREALVFKNLNSLPRMVSVLASIEDFEKAYTELISAHSLEAKKRIQNELRARTGATQKTLSWLENTPH